MLLRVLFGLIIISLLATGVTQNGFAETVPAWIKDTAKWYGDGQISEKEFLNAIRYLVNNGILDLDENPPKSQIIVIPTPNIPDLDAFEIPVSENDTREEVLSSDFELIKFKVLQLTELIENPKIIQAVIDSNIKFNSMENAKEFISTKDKEWKATPKDQESPFMGVLIENSISKILKQKQKISTDEFGDVLFPEIIITNAFGANVAITGRTDDYNQGDEGWWLRATNQDVTFREVLWDDSVKIFSSDIVMKIKDKHGRFIGVLNAATPIR